MKDFYVYIWLREKDGAFPAGTAYYVGKTGQRKRACGLPHTVPAPKNKACVRLLDCASEADALKLEMLLIRIHGRIDLGTGCLRNRTDGGEGTSGVVRTAETRARVRAANLGKVFSVEHRAKISAALFAYHMSIRQESQLHGA
jgi:hypothetical protein